MLRERLKLAKSPAERAGTEAQLLHALIRSRRFEEAVQLARRAAFKPQASERHWRGAIAQLTMAVQQSGRLGAERKALQDRSLEELSHRELVFLSNLQRGGGQSESLVKTLRHVMATHPKDIHARSQLVTVLIGMKKLGDASELVEKMRTEKSAQFTHGALALARAYKRQMKLGPIQKLAEQIETYQSGTPADQTALSIASRVYVLAGDQPSALKTLSRWAATLKRDIEIERARLREVEVLMDTGSGAKAIARLAELEEKLNFDTNKQFAKLLRGRLNTSR